jgi:O-acetyl-ADP-ribose deacetylase (regulator of RNase III)
MPIDYLIKDITTVDDGVIVHGCNCVGGFGSGVAGAIRRKWPMVHASFTANGTGGQLLGTTQILEDVVENVTVINGYTQLTCGYDGQRYADPDAIQAVLLSAANHANIYDKDLYMPKIGAGLGGLDWETEVLPIVELVSSEFPNVNIHICDIE